MLLPPRRQSPRPAPLLLLLLETPQVLLARLGPVQQPTLVPSLLLAVVVAVAVPLAVRVLGVLVQAPMQK